MRVFRIEREKYLAETLNGTGASLTSGFRWNSIGTRMVYTSESRALAVLEVNVHLDFAEDLPSDRFIVEIEIPDEVETLTLDPESLPGNWDSFPPPVETCLIGDEFVSSKAAAVLKVPSCIVQQEFNFLINPNHPDAGKIKVISTSPFRFDSRLKK